MKNYIIALSLATLIGCQSTPQNIILLPNYTVSHAAAFSVPATLTVLDKRNTNTTVTVNYADRQEALPSKQLVPNLTQSFSDAFTRRGSIITAQANHQIEIVLHQLHTGIEQQLHKHASSGTVDIELKMSHAGQTFSKHYTGNHNAEGPFSYDKAKVESQMNRLLENIIDRMMLDPEVIQFLQG